MVGCALLVSLGSWWMFPRSWISFGVLHGLAAMLLIARGLLAVGLLRAAVPWVLGAALVAGAPWLGEWLGTRPLHVAALFDSRWLNWIGVVTHKPITEDYVPLLPWLGVLLLGVGAGQALPPVVLAPPVGALRRKLAVLGRWSLSYYMLHQPVLIGALMAWGAVRG